MNTFSLSSFLHPVLQHRMESILKMCQMGFIDYFANDMFEAWDAFGDFPELIEHLRSNYSYWQGQQRIREAASPSLLSPTSGSTPSSTTAALPTSAAAQSASS